MRSQCDPRQAMRVVSPAMVIFLECRADGMKAVATEGKARRAITTDFMASYVARCSAVSKDLAQRVVR